ncbi:MAG: hypothetical protein CVV42_01395 [Candidatus Riflebacteria bacterium HGW-Riflebacteria-2]|jgi:ADP-heptose:LPS heptosyltransferase|nr:MAG: hypothetical protein CVV42_01395 [Candidatus Riflebacteria bacterium HGW-Riflebacteria-2]
MSDTEIVLRLNAMGDILLTLPTLHAIAKRGIDLHMVIHGRWAQLGEFLPASIHYYNGTGSLIKLAGQLKKLHARAVFDLQGKLSTIALRSMLNAPITRVYQKRNLGEQLLAMRGKYPLRFSDQRPVWQKYGEVCGVNLDNPDASLNLSDDYLDACRKILQELGLQEKQFILLHPDASNPGKIIPEALLAALQDGMPQITALIGTSTDVLPSGINSLDLRNHFSLYHLPGIIHLATAVVSSDSGPMHLARAVGTPLVALFFQTCPSLGFAPIPADNVMVLSEPMPCKPCSLHGQNFACPEGHFACRNVEIPGTVAKIARFFKNFI